MPQGAAAHVYRLMQKALADLPPRYLEQVENVDFAVTRVPSPRDRRRLRLGNATLYGHYEGIPLTHRGGAYDRVLPDRITLYWGPLVRDFPDGASLESEVRKTLYHEIAHYFGLDESDLFDSSVR
jgi:predicted Zn-dependent protease with MMP-like domain